jgi:translation elongation factor EF-1alpha
MCIVEALDSMRLPVRNFVKPCRVTVMEYTPKASGSLIGDCIMAKVEAGAIDEKD